ncbi:MAG: 3-keto-5-aminohexanoate cleavage protein [Spirochaetaceae bacterium]|nr:3-keto-5-aminohexanoate cleavage protein [Spirochaetaceae bacterium]
MRPSCVRTHGLGLFLRRGVPATNAQLVEQAAAIIEAMGATVIGPDRVRERLKLTKRAPR